MQDFDSSAINPTLNQNFKFQNYRAKHTNSTSGKFITAISTTSEAERGFAAPGDKEPVTAPLFII